MNISQYFYIFRNRNLLINIMSTNTNNNVQLRLLEGRLNDAEYNVTQLFNNVKKLFADIRKDINILKSNDDTDTFENSLKHNSRICESERSLGPSVKRIKLEDFATNGDFTVVYTDGACTNNGRKNAKAGIGVWWGENHPLNVSKPTTKRNTNNAAEIQACTEACKIAAQNGIDRLLIKTDSQFVINCLTKWIIKWKKNNWKTASGAEVINKEDLVELELTSKLLKAVKYEHVDGHSGHHGNEEADKLAVKGAQMN